MWIVRRSAFLLLGCSLFSCVPRDKSESTVAYAVGDWWATPSNSLLPAMKSGSPLSLCVSSYGNPDPQKLENDVKYFDDVVRRAWQEWASALNVRLSIESTPAPCINDLAQGRLQVVLHYDQNYFQTRISQTATPTLGVFSVGDGGLHLNVDGVLNPARDPSKGYKTTLHELGHALGLNHSVVPGAVMQAFLNRANAKLTTDDMEGIRAAWARLPASAKAENKSNDNGTRVPGTAVEAPTQAAVVNTAAPLPRVPNEQTRVRIKMRYGSWFKASTAQSFALSAAEKCALEVDQQLQVFLLNGGSLETGHLKVKLADGLAGCAFGQVGAVGYLYQPHID